MLTIPKKCKISHKMNKSTGPQAEWEQGVACPTTKSRRQHSLIRLHQDQSLIQLIFLHFLLQEPPIHIHTPQSTIPVHHLAIVPHNQPWTNPITMPANPHPNFINPKSHSTQCPCLLLANLLSISRTLHSGLWHCLSALLVISQMWTCQHTLHGSGEHTEESSPASNCSLLPKMYNMDGEHAAVSPSGGRVWWCEEG